MNMKRELQKVKPETEIEIEKKKEIKMTKIKKMKVSNVHVY